LIQTGSNKKRNQTADLLKGLAVIFMIQVHIMEQFATPDIYNSFIGKISLFLGGPPCAPVFMAVMGYFLASSDKPFSYYLKRGAVLFAGGILLNITRSANLLHYIFIGQSSVDPFFYIFGVDILLLAGLSLVIIGLLKIIFKKNYFFYFALAVLIAAASPYMPQVGTTICFSSYLNAFLWGNFEWSYFPLFPWCAYIILGVGFRLFCENAKFHSKYNASYSLVLSLPLLVAAGLTIKYAAGIAHNLGGADGYYHHGILFFGWMIMFMLGYIMLVHLIEEHAGRQAITRFIKWVGKNVTVIYIIQWIIIGNIATEIYQTQENAALVYWFLGVTAVTCVLAYAWEYFNFSFIKNKHKNL
jgi:uncharacterized membrane protein